MTRKSQIPPGNTSETWQWAPTSDKKLSSTCHWTTTSRKQLMPSSTPSSSKVTYNHSNLRMEPKFKAFGTRSSPVSGTVSKCHVTVLEYMTNGFRTTTPFRSEYPVTGTTREKDVEMSTISRPFIRASSSANESVDSVKGRHSSMQFDLTSKTNAQ